MSDEKELPVSVIAIALDKLDVRKPGTSAVAVIAALQNAGYVVRDADEITRLRARIAEKDEALGFIRGWTAKRDADGMTFSKQRLLIGIVDCHARKALEG